MNIYTVTYEARKQGAIGTFSVETLTVEAESKGQASRLAMQRLNEQGFECRFPRTVEAVQS